jgi:putative endonuclease
VTKLPARRREGLGAWGEAVAAQALEARGYEIIERNWRCQLGELDLVARDGETWVFVEVKARRNEVHGTPEESVTPSKRNRLLILGEAYVSEHALGDVAWRVDVVAIVATPDRQVRSLEVYQNAIERE